MTLPDTTRVDFDAANNPIYLGQAAPGSATSDPVWQIRKLTFVGGNPVAIQYAGGQPEFTSIWDQRTSLPYA